VHKYTKKGEMRLQKTEEL